MQFKDVGMSMKASMVLAHMIKDKFSLFETIVFTNMCELIVEMLLKLNANILLILFFIECKMIHVFPS